MKNKGALILGLITAVVGFLILFCPVYVVVSDWYDNISINLFDIAKGYYVYEVTRIIAIMLVIIMFVGICLTIVGAITCYLESKPLKAMSIIGAILIMFSSLGATIIGFLAIGTYGSHLVFPCSEFYFALSCGVGIPFIIICSRQKYVSKFVTSSSSSTNMTTSNIGTNPSIDTNSSAQVIQNTEGLIYAELMGAQRVLNVYQDRVELIQLQNFRSVLTRDFFKGTKEIPFTSMSAIQFKEASNMVLGFIQFEVPGTHTSSNFGSENSWTFDKSMNSKAREVADYCRKMIRQANAPQQNIINQSNSSIADEIKKFKELLECGAITQDEFDAKKKELLKL